MRGKEKNVRFYKYFSLKSIVYYELLSIFVCTFYC